MCDDYLGELLKRFRGNFGCLVGYVDLESLIFFDKFSGATSSVFFADDKDLLGMLFENLLKF